MRLLKNSLYFFLTILLISCHERIPPEERLLQGAEKILSQILHQQKQWVKVHAAEFLIDLGMTDGIDSIFLAEEKLYGNQSPYRIGIWRVLSKVNASPSKWKNNIIKIAQDTIAPDQLNAIEAAAKLKVPPSWIPRMLKIKILNGDDLRMKTYLEWALAVPDNNLEKPGINSIKELLRSTDATIKQIAALALKELDHFPAEEWNGLADLALKESDGSKAKIHLLAAALTLCSDQNLPQFKQLEKSILGFKNSYTKANRYALCETLARVGNKKHLVHLKDLMYCNNPILSIETMESPQEHPWNIDVSGAAAYAILKVIKRTRISD